jgi:hypothetical protein
MNGTVYRHSNVALSKSTILFDVRSNPLKVVPQPDRSVSVHFAFSEQKFVSKVSEFPLKQIEVLKLPLQDAQNLCRAVSLRIARLQSRGNVDLPFL